MKGIDFSFPSPSKMDNGKSIKFIAMSEQNVIHSSGRGKSKNWNAID